MKKEDGDIINAKSRSEWVALINEWIHDEVDRRMLVRHLLDNIKLEPLGQEFGFSTVHTQKRMSMAKNQLFKHI